ncbi:CopG family transcriptional regulator [Streptomyces sp. NPDC014889]|uniref:CopG family transcriptional regulator n=1 Tax=Streptomyces sp. NPDC014889 TaxID=3364928 RepID=UPI0036F55151
MAMDLHLRDDQAEALKRCAEAEGVSVHSIVLRAVDDYLAATAHAALVRKAAEEQAAKWAELLERLK